MKAFDRLIAASLPAVPRVVVRRIADRYIAGETLDDAVATVRELNHLGAMATVDVLGEFISRPEEAEETATEYERVLDAIAAGQLDANVSVKLSALGIEIDRELVDGTLARVLRTASSSASTWSTAPSRTRRWPSTATCAPPDTRTLVS